MKIYYWSPFTTNIATIQAVLRSAESLAKFGRNMEPKIINAVGEWDIYCNKDSDVKKISLSNFKITKYFKNKGFVSSRLIYVVTFLICFFKLKKLLNKEKPNYLIIHLVTSLPLILLVLFNFKTKFILRISGYPKLNLFRKILWRIAGKKLFLITAPSISTYEELKKINIFEQKKIKLLFDPVFKIRELPARKKELLNFKVDNNYYYLVSIGRLTKQKNFQYLIKEYSKIKKDFPKYRLIIIGDGEEKNKLIKLIDNLNLKSDVILAGYQKNIYKYLKLCKCFILCSLWEDPGFVLIEAAVSNTNIISCDSLSGPKDFFKNDNGFKFKNNTNDDLYKSFSNFNYSNKDEIYKKLKNAKIYSKQFSFFNHYNQLFKLLI